MQCRIQRSLKDTLSIGYEVGLKRIKPSIISVWETDSNPTLSTFNKMIEVFLNEKSNGIASVSPMYKWNGNYCYPTHNHWLSDPIYKITESHGKLTCVHAVPFLFSVWEPLVFKYIKNNDFRNFIGLDTDFGTFLSKKGYKHIRLRDYYVEHVGGGKKSWK